MIKNRFCSGFIFKNLSKDEDQEYFCEGFSEDLLSMLSRFNKLVVISSHASFAYKDKNKSFKDIGNDLGVRYIIHGSVRNLDQKCGSMQTWYPLKMKVGFGPKTLIYLLMRFLMFKIKLQMKL